MLMPWFLDLWLCYLIKQKMKIVAYNPITSWQIDGKTMKTVTDFVLFDWRITADGDCSHEINMLTPWKKSYDQPRQHIKKQRHYFSDKVMSSQSYGFSISHAWMWELNHQESWVSKNRCFWMWCWRRLLRVACTWMEIKLINPTGN